ncbi:MAG: polymerase subunit delta [Solirubrobacteraceae bacterium]|nr:polymerase subunit delta [Solirubrobacteraceae bacterium]
MPTTLPGTEPHPHARAVLGAGLPPDGQPSHAYLFHGPSGTGKRAVAQAFATALLAQDAPDPEAVAIRVEHRAHPDLMWVAPSGAHELLVDDVRPVVTAAARTPFEATRRVFVIERADTMNDEAANRMLKTLEEPPAFVHIVLLTDRPSEVLETIASRCQAVRFDPLPTTEIARRLTEQHGVEADAATACARLSLGDAARAQALATGEGPQLRAAAERFARAARAGDMASRPWMDVLARARARGDAAVAALDAAHEADRELVAKRDRRRSETEHTERSRRAQRRAYTETLDLALGLAGLWFRDVACVAWDAPDLAAHADRAAELEQDADGADPQRLRQAVELVEDTRQRLVLNVNEELACEALAYRLERLLSGA